MCVQGPVAQSQILIKFVFAGYSLSMDHFKSKSKDLLARNQNNVFEWSDMSTQGLLFKCWSSTQRTSSLLHGHHNLNEIKLVLAIRAAKIIFGPQSKRKLGPPPPILQIMILKLSPPRCVISKEESVQQK